VNLSSDGIERILVYTVNAVLSKNRTYMREEFERELISGFPLEVTKGLIQSVCVKVPPEFWAEILRDYANSKSMGFIPLHRAEDPKFI